MSGDFSHFYSAESMSMNAFIGAHAHKTHTDWQKGASLRLTRSKLLNESIMNGRERTIHTHAHAHARTRTRTHTHTHTHTHQSSTETYNVNDGLSHTSAASVSDNQTCQIILKEKKDTGYESEPPYALFVSSAPSRRVKMKRSVEREMTERTLSVWS